LFIVERFWQEFVKFSRRTEAQIKQWAKRYGFKQEPREILNAAKGEHDRYTCVNLNNSRTIKFRIFKGTLKYNIIIATLQLVDYICDVAFSMSDMEIERLSWCSFVEKINKDKYSELIQYLKERRLYINERIIAKEEE